MSATEPGRLPPSTRKTLMTRRGRVVVLVASCFVASTIALALREEPSREDRAAPETGPRLADVKLTPTVAPAPARTVLLARRQPAAPATPIPVPIESDYTTVVTAPAPPEQNAVAPPSLVTISGCLQRDDERFVLRDTAGGAAPRSRSWRSGFVMRSTSTIDVVDEADSLHLPTYVGQRVSVTGMLVDREMILRSVTIVAESCEERSA